MSGLDCELSCGRWRRVEAGMKQRILYFPTMVLVWCGCYFEGQVIFGCLVG